MKQPASWSSWLACPLTYLGDISASTYLGTSAGEVHDDADEEAGEDYSSDDEPGDGDGAGDAEKRSQDGETKSND